MNINPNNINYSSISLGRIQAAQRIANVLYQLGSQHLFVSEEIALQNDEELSSLVEDCYQSLQKRLYWPPRRPNNANTIILDQPEMRYLELIFEHRNQRGFTHIDFLCGGMGETSHFRIALDEYGNNISYQCLNIPVEKWGEYKILKKYKGD